MWGSLRLAQLACMQCVFGAEPECKSMQFAKLEQHIIWNVIVVPYIYIYIYIYTYIYRICAVQYRL